MRFLQFLDAFGWVAGKKCGPQTPCHLSIKVLFQDRLRKKRTHTHPFNGPLSGTTQVSWYQKGKTRLDFTEARDSEWQWHQLGRVQVCTSLQTDNHASTHHSVFYRPDALPAAHGRKPTVNHLTQVYQANDR